MPKKPPARAKSPYRRALELVRFLEDVALGKTAATDSEIEAAARELDKYLPDLPPVEVDEP